MTATLSECSNTSAMNDGDTHTTRAHLSEVADVKPQKAAHIPALDGVRGTAILMVMLFHMGMVPPVGHLAQAWQQITLQGGLGVDVFFVLSGFLITGILLDSRDSPNYFRNFYGRRVLRIFPLYYAVVFFSLVVLPRVAPWTIARFGRVNHDALWYWFHLSNFAIARRGAFAHGILDVSWSLAIEEQFYLLWPAVVLRVPPKRLHQVCIVLIVVSCASRLLLTSFGAAPVAVYTLTFCRLDGLAAGALVALLARTGRIATIGRWLIPLALGSILIFAVMMCRRELGLPTSVSAGFTYLAVSGISSSAILAILASPKFLVSKVFTLAPLRALGRYSYAIYLFHYPIAALLRDKVLVVQKLPLVWGSSLPSQAAFDLIAIGLSFAAATLSWHAYEQWFLRLKRYF